jgi:hypothetical protein
MALIRDLFGLEVEASSEEQRRAAEPLAEVRELRPRT